jgi:hypothetical protein
MEIISNDSGLSRVAVAIKRLFVATVAVTPLPARACGVVWQERLLPAESFLPVMEHCGASGKIENTTPSPYQPGDGSEQRIAYKNKIFLQ